MHEQPQWQPISMLPLLSDLLDQQLGDIQGVLDALRQARSKPHVMDDYTIGRVISSYTEQRDFIMDIYPEQIARWRKATKSVDQNESVERFDALYKRVVASMDQAITLAREISGCTIDKILGMEEGDLAVALMTGKLPFPEASPGNEVKQAKERYHIAEVLDACVEELVEAECDDYDILANMAQYMPGLRHLMDTAGRDELDRLMTEFPNLRRFVQLLEDLARKIQSGEVQVPR